MKKILSILLMSLFSHTLLAGPVVEVFECTLNEGKTVNDANNMMAAFSDYVDEAGPIRKLYGPPRLSAVIRIRQIR